MLKKLGKYDAMLKDICLIEGVGLSSNIYTIGRNSITLIDTGNGEAVNKITPKFEALELDPSNITQVVITHSHYDHIGGLRELLSITKPKIMVHIEDSNPIEEEVKQKVTKLKDADIVNAENCQLKVISTPGHSHGSICLYNPDRKLLFSGDTVFAEGGFGRTDLETGDSRKMVESLERLAELDVNILLPGHDKIILENASKWIRQSFDEAKTLLF